MKAGGPGTFGARLKALRETAGFTQEELATIAGLSVHAVSALERGERRRPHVETVRALSAALDLTAATRDALVESARAAGPKVGQQRDLSLPLPLTALLGRDADLQTLRLWLADSTTRLITLTGPGGAGKTRLALELARVTAECGGRVLFVGLGAIRNAASVAPAVAEALGVLDATALDLPRRARAACDGTPTLLLLDNFEQVLDAAPLVADLLASVAALRVLITSRAPLRVRGEREYGVGPLALHPLVDAMSTADLARSPAVRLFLERARDVQPEFRLTPANGPPVAEICRRLDGLPLALELAAPWVKVLTVEQLLGRLTDNPLLSTAGPRDLPQRQQTINATVAWSYQLLAPNEQRVFRRLGALPGRFPIEAAAAVLAGHHDSPLAIGEALSAAAALIDKSLLVRAESALATRPLYQMLETVRAYAALELSAAGERDDALQGLAQYCSREAALAAEGLVGAAQGEWLDRVRDDLDSYRGALAWLIASGGGADASEIGWRLMLFWVIRGHAAEGLRWYEHVLSVHSLPLAAQARALVGAAAMRYVQGELDGARDALTHALAAAHGAGDMEMVAHAENLFGHVEHAAGNVTAARDRFAHSVREFQARGIAWGHGNALSGMAGVALATGDTDTAERLLDEATSALRVAGPWFQLLTLYVRAVLAVRRRLPDQAIAVTRDSLARIRDLDDRFAFVYTLPPLAAAAILKGDDAWAARILGALDAVAERTGATFVDKSLSLAGPVGATVETLKEQAEREVRARLGPDRWARAYAAGRSSSSVGSLIDEIDRVMERQARA